MISGQTLIAEMVEENFIPVQNSIETAHNSDLTEPAIEANAVPTADQIQTIDLNAKFARLKKSIRRRSAGIF